jgi:predicted GNAT family N-acyltransferase
MEGLLVLQEGSWTELREPALAVRRAVFQAEQGVAAHYDEDGYDSESIHIVIETGDRRPIGTSRIRGDHLGRLAVVKEARNQGIGFLLVASMLRVAHRQRLPQVWANAQPGALGLARIFGFTIEPEEYELAGLPHYRVVKRLDGGEHLDKVGE